MSTGLSACCRAPMTAEPADELFEYGQEIKICSECGADWVEWDGEPTDRTGDYRTEDDV